MNGNYYSREAAEIAEWAFQESNRLKSARIYRAAQSLESRYRKNHKGEVNDPYTFPRAQPLRYAE